MSKTLTERVATTENLTVVAAILLSLPLTYAASTVFGYSDGAALLLLTIAVGVPRAYNEQWPAGESTLRAVGWVLGAGVLTTGAFAACYFAGTGLVSLSEAPASAVSFVLTMGGLEGATPLLVAWRREQDTRRVDSSA